MKPKKRKFTKAQLECMSETMETKVRFTAREVELIEGDIEITITMNNQDFDQLIRTFYKVDNQPLLRLIVLPPKGEADGNAKFEFNSKTKVIFENFYV